MIIYVVTAMADHGYDFSATFWVVSAYQDPLVAASVAADLEKEAEAFLKTEPVWDHNLEIKENDRISNEWCTQGDARFGQGFDGPADFITFHVEPTELKGP